MRVSAANPKHQRLNEELAMPYAPARIRPLTPDELNKWFDEHLKQRYTWLVTHRERANKGDELFDGDCAFNECAYGAAMLAARFYLQFLGLKVENGQLGLGRQWFTKQKGGVSYEVKVTDLGGEWVELVSDLDTREQELVARVWEGANQGVAHLTDGYPHGFKWEELHETIDIIVRLLRKRLFAVTKREPEWHGKGWMPNMTWVKK
jgi:hypothetical protein